MVICPRGLNQVLKDGSHIVNWTVARDLLRPESFSFLATVFVMLPAAAFLSHLRIESGLPLPPKSRRYRLGICFQILVAGCAIQFARAHQITLFPATTPEGLQVSYGFLFVAAGGIGLRRGWPRLTEKRRRRALLLLPENTRELGYWVLISLLAGFGEELAYRGALFYFLREVTGSAPFAIGLCVLAFGVAHVAQGPRAILGTGILALFFHLLVFVTGTLYVAMLAHAGYDLVIGLIALQYARREAPAHLQPAGAS